MVNQIGKSVLFCAVGLSVFLGGCGPASPHDVGYSLGQTMADQTYVHKYDVIPQADLVGLVSNACKIAAQSAGEGNDFVTSCENGYVATVDAKRG